MTLCFFSNFLNPHQIYFCEALKQILGDGFTFVATEKFDKTVVSKGFQDVNEKYSFCLESYKSDENMQKAENLAKTADVMVYGSAPIKFLKLRMRANKLCFRYSERVFRAFTGGNPKNLKFMLWLFLTNTIYNQKPLYLLATSAYAAGDFARVGAYKNKAFKWGYFPQGSSKKLAELLDLKKKNEKPIILWAARMLPLKHGEMAIKTAEYLKNKGLSFTLKMVGDGEQETQLKQMARDKNLENCIEFLGSLPYNSTINEMESADIFIFSSDENEGWGAVVNESMSAGCAVVACNSAGSVPFLIKDGENGFRYDFDDEGKLFSGCEKLIINSSLRKKIAENAFKNINETWNGKTAAKNLVALSKAILNKTEQDIVQTGPCSKC